MASSCPAEVSLDWRKSEAENGHQKRFEHILESGFRSDVVFIVGAEKEEIKAHKLILSTGSKVFDDLFHEYKDTSSFEVTDLEPAEFTLLLKFLYTGECPIKVEEYLPVINAASNFDVSDLVRRCGKLLGKTLTPDSAIKVFQQAIKYGDPELEEKALKCICKNGFKIIESGPFMDLNVDELSKILERDDLEVKNETQLFEAVMNWGKAELKRQKMIETDKYLRSVLEKVIYLVRFPQMDQSDFSLKVYSSKILLDSDYIAVLMYFGIPEKNRGSASSGPFNSKSRVAYTPRGKEFILQRLVKSSGKVMDLATRLNTGKKYIPPTFQEHSIRLKSDTSIWVKSIGMNSLFVLPPNLTCRKTYTCQKCKGSTTTSDKCPKCDVYELVLTNSSKYGLPPNLTCCKTYICQKCKGSTSTSDKCPKCDVQEAVAVMIQLKNDANKVLASKTETIRSFSASKVYHIQFNKPVHLRADEWHIATFAVFSGSFCGNQYQPTDGVGAQMSVNVKDEDGTEKVVFEFENDVNPRYTGTTQGFIPEIGFMIE